MISDLHTWATMLDDYFGVRLTAEKQQRWQELLRQSVDTGNAELMDVIPWVADRRRPNQYSAKPTVEQLGIWVKWYRKEMAAQRHGYRPDTEQGRIGHIKNRMMRADSWRDRWNIMCGHGVELHAQGRSQYDDHDPRTLGECRELDEWARERWPDWDEQVAEVKSGLGSQNIGDDDETGT